MSVYQYLKEMNFMKTFVSGLALASLVSSTALAATTTTPVPAGAQTTATAQSVAAPKLLDKVTASIAGTFYGPSVATATGNSDYNTVTQVPNAEGTGMDSRL